VIPTCSPSQTPSIAPTSAPTYRSTGINRLSSDSSRDAYWKVISVPLSSTFKVGDNAVILQPAHSAWLPNSAASAWIGTTLSGFDDAPIGNYQYQTTFSVPCTTLEVKFSADDRVLSVVVSNGITSTTITTFIGINEYNSLSSFTATGLLGSVTTTMTFTIQNAVGPSGLLVQFGALTGCP